MQRKKIIILIVIIALVALGIFFFFFRKKTVKGPETGTPKTEEKEGVKPEGQLQEEGLSAVEKKQKEEEMALNLKAKNFIERVGSFSSDSKDLNLREIKAMMADSLFKKLQKDLLQELEMNKDGFYGKTTKVISSLKRTEFDPEVRAHFKSDVQIQETKAEPRSELGSTTGGETTNKTISYKTAEITFLKQSGEWKAVEMAVY
ncbi:hypothetical protein GW896_02260 [Candidatus Kuenenbacteria bacterium]|nr:hypothetical protein [Candidatus Kuenenbacteria bacterium]